MRFFIGTFIVLFISTSLFAQRKVTFFAKDSLLVTADLYETKHNYPWIILLHQAGASRGEYREIAPKLQRLGFNCMAVDLRSGEEVNFIKNETAQRAANKGLSVNYIDTEADILGALDYVSKKTYTKVLLFGSSYSASLALWIGKKHDKVEGIIAFSPGEFFKPQYEIDKLLRGMGKPIFAASSQREYPYLQEILAHVLTDYKSLFKPQNGQGQHGAKALWDSDPASKEYWLALVLFLKQFSIIN